MKAGIAANAARGMVLPGIDLGAQAINPSDYPHGSDVPAAILQEAAHMPEHLSDHHLILSVE
jgi:hypothetical protein